MLIFLDFDVSPARRVTSPCLAGMVPAGATSENLLRLAVNDWAPNWIYISVRVRKVQAIRFGGMERAGWGVDLWGLARRARNHITVSGTCRRNQESPIELIPYFP